MTGSHVAFVVHPGYGHIIPTLGIAVELLRRGHRVSYAVPPSLAPGIRRLGAQPMIFDPLDTRPEILRHTLRQGGSHDFNFEDVGLSNLLKQLREQRTAHSVAQLEHIYQDDRPTLIVHDSDALDLADSVLASKWQIPRIRHVPILLNTSYATKFPDDEVILVSIPRFLIENPDQFDERFKFIGFLPEGRKQLYRPWPFSNVSEKTILVSPTTGLLPQIEFLRLAIRAFENTPWRIVLSISGELDPLSRTEQTSIGDLPSNFQLNGFSSNLDILEHASLFIGHGGPGSTLEALYCGVPVLLIPPSQLHSPVAHRISELGLGTYLPFSDASAGNLRQSATSLLEDVGTHDRVKQVQRAMHRESGATVAADLIERHMSVSE